MMCYLKYYPRVLLPSLGLLFVSAIGNAHANLSELNKPTTFEPFIAEMVKEHQFSATELKKVFNEVTLHQSIIDAISRPAESKPWYQYRPIFLTSDRMRGGIRFWKEHKQELERASQVFGVPEEIIVAIVGVETRYGKHTGRYPVIDSLSTLAFAYPPRSDFFRQELKQYLLMTREEKLDPLKQMGSYAGAMGMPQFISSSFRSYAIDFNKDGHRDLWESHSDVIGSVANYFKKHRWIKGQPVAHRVEVHGKKYLKLLTERNELKPKYTAEYMLENGVVLPRYLPEGIQGRLIKLDGENGPEYWIAWHNFYVISRYNHSALYSMAVFQLSQEMRKQMQASE